MWIGPYPGIACKQILGIEKAIEKAPQLYLSIPDGISSLAYPSAETFSVKDDEEKLGVLFIYATCFSVLIDAPL